MGVPTTSVDRARLTETKTSACGHLSDMPTPPRKKMLLVACAVSAGTTLVACSNDQACNGFYPADAMPDVTGQDAPSGCLGFYPLDATVDVAFDAPNDADVADGGDAGEQTDGDASDE